MITLSTFQKYLANDAALPTPTSTHSEGQAQQLRQWAAGLSMQTEAHQAHQLEEVLTELAVTDVEDAQRLQLMDIVVTATDRLVTSLHKHYIYELTALSAEQMKYLDQVKSLYYLTILVYDGVVKRQSRALEQHAQGAGWRRLLGLPKSAPLTLAAAIYQSLVSYQKLIYEKSLFYQQPPDELWGELNKLYYLASEHKVAHTDLSRHVVIRKVNSIHQLYTQLCLHSLLNVRTMRRPSISLLQRLLPVWTEYVHATRAPKTKTRLFIDLQGNNPPEYYTTTSSINPYDEQNDCLFIDIESLAAHLQQSQHTSSDKPQESVEYRLVNKVLMLLNHRYLNRQTVIATKMSPKQRATVVTGFNGIHYHVAGETGLLTLIDAPTLPPEQLPRHDTRPKKGESISIMAVETFDSTDVFSHFRTLQLLDSNDLFTKKTLIDEKLAKPSAEHSQDLQNVSLSQMPPNTAPPLLRMMTLILLCRPHNQNKMQWSLGMVRWLNFENTATPNDPKHSDDKQSNSSKNAQTKSNRIEVEWQVFGHGLTACALRLDNSDKLDNRGQHFVPAFIIEEDVYLKTDSSLLVPPYLFHTNDKVIVRIGSTQTTLRLQQSLLNTEEFSQYKVVQV